MLTEVQTKEYLDTLGFEANVAPDKETLDELILRHQSTIPFQTVTLHRTGKLPSLDSQDIYDKVVTRKLGGYCFELNKAFHELLESIGYNVHPAISRAVRGRVTRMPINHRSIIVELDDSLYSADVGFGGPMPAGAMKLEEGTEQLIEGDTYIAEQADDAWWKLDRLTQSSKDLYDDGVPARRQTELELCTAKVEEIDFDSMNHFFSQPGTLFHDHEIANLRIDGGYYGLMDNVFTKRQNGQKEVIELEDREAVDDVLAEYFGIVDADK